MEPPQTNYAPTFGLRGRCAVDRDFNGKMRPNPPCCGKFEP